MLFVESLEDEPASCDSYTPAFPQPTSICFSAFIHCLANCPYVLTVYSFYSLYFSHKLSQIGIHQRMQCEQEKKAPTTKKQAPGRTRGGFLALPSSRLKERTRSSVTGGSSAE